MNNSAAPFATTARPDAGSTGLPPSVGEGAQPGAGVSPAWNSTSTGDADAVMRAGASNRTGGVVAPMGGASPNALASEPIPSVVRPSSEEVRSITTTASPSRRVYTVTRPYSP